LLPLNNNLTAKENTLVLEAITEDAYTLSYQTDEGEIGGYSVELFKAVMADAKLEYELKVVPWARTYRRVQNEKNIIVFPMAWTKERASKFKWVGEITPVNYTLYCLTKDLPSEPMSLAQLKKQTIAVPRSDIRAEHLKKNQFTNLILTTGNAQLTNLIKRGRISYFLSSKIGLNQLISQNNMKPSDFTRVYSFKDLQTRLYFVLSLQTDDEIYNKISASYKNIVQNGTYEKIMSPLFKLLQHNSHM